MHHFDKWLSDVVEYVDGVRDYTAVWAHVGITGEWLDLFSEFQPIFTGGRLQVSAHLREDPATPGRLRAAFMHLCRFRSFSASRWGGVSETARGLIGAMLMGLGSLVRHSLAVSKEGDKLFLKGFLRFGEDVKQMLAIVICSSMVSDSVLDIIREDDRLVRQLSHIDDEIQLSLTYTSSLQTVVFDSIAEVLELNAAKLRRLSMQAALVQAAHIGAALREARRLPWSLAGGDIRRNLQLLSQGPRPSEEVSAKIYDALLLGLDVEELARGVELLRDLPWSSEAVEQGHAAASRVLKAHRQLGAKAAQARAMISHISSLVSMSEEEKRIAKLVDRCTRLQNVQVERITGRHVFFGDLQRMAKERRDEGLPLWVSRPR